MTEWGGWVLAFGLTQAIEAPLYAVALRERGLARAAGIALGASALTHPFVWFAFPALFAGFEGSDVVRVAVSEAFAVGVEALYLSAWGVPRAFWWSLAVNGASFSVGLSLSLLIGWP